MIPKVHFDIMFHEKQLTKARRVISKYGGGAVSAMRHVQKEEYMPALISGREDAALGWIQVISAIGLLGVVSGLADNPYGMESLREDEVFLDIVNLQGGALGLRGQSLASFVDLTAHVYYSCGSWYRSGSKLYEMMPGLVQRLVHTDFRGMRGEDVVLPFGSVYLICPNTGLHVQNDLSGAHALVGLYMTLSDTPREGERVLSFLAIGECREAPRGKLPDDALTYWSVVLKNGQPLDECLRLSKERMRCSKKTVQQAWSEMTYFGVKAMCYATSSNVRADILANDPRADKLKERLANKKLKPKQREKLRSELKGLDQRRRTVLGIGYQILQHNSGNPLSVRTLVSGHFRMVPHGPGRQARRKTWIIPFWRGPIDGEVSNPNRILK